MGTAMTDERFALLREKAEAALPILNAPGSFARDVLELADEIDRLRAALATVGEVQACVAPSARPMCDHDGEDWPCAAIRAVGGGGRFEWEH